VALAALDTYMHRLIVSRAYEHKEMPRNLAGVPIRFEDLIAQADAAVEARKEGRATRPKVRAKRILRERLAFETFQRYDRVGDALAMAGKPKSWAAIAAALPGSATPETLKDELNRIVDRRNAIVHEGDYVRQDRPRGATKVTITGTEARRCVRFVSELIDAIHNV
jgi:hypothetical protein